MDNPRSDNEAQKMKEVEKSSQVSETNGLLKFFDRPLKPDEQ